MSGGLIGITTITPQMAIKYLGFQQFNQIFDNKMGSAFCAVLVDGAFLGPILAMQSFKQINHQMKIKTDWDIVRKNYGRLMVPISGYLSLFPLLSHSNFKYLNYNNFIQN
jgi:hypothetical protein